MMLCRRSYALQCLIALVIVSSFVLTKSQGAGAIGHMTYHGGEVMGTTTTYAIFWLPPDRHFEKDSAGDIRYQQIVTRFLTDVGGSPYYSVLTQYSKDDGGNPVKNGPIQNQSTFGGSYVDTSPYPHAGTQQDPLQRNDLQAEVSRAMAANHWPGASTSYLSCLPLVPRSVESR